MAQLSVSLKESKVLEEISHNTSLNFNFFFFQKTRIFFLILASAHAASSMVSSVYSEYCQKTTLCSLCRKWKAKKKYSGDKSVWSESIISTGIRRNHDALQCARVKNCCCCQYPLLKKQHASCTHTTSFVPLERIYGIHQLFWLGCWNPFSIQK